MVTSDAMQGNSGSGFFTSGKAARGGGRRIAGLEISGFVMDGENGEHDGLSGVLGTLMLSEQNGTGASVFLAGQQVNESGGDILGFSGFRLSSPRTFGDASVPIGLEPASGFGWSSLVDGGLVDTASEDCVARVSLVGRLTSSGFTEGKRRDDPGFFEAIVDVDGLSVRVSLPRSVAVVESGLSVLDTEGRSLTDFAVAATGLLSVGRFRGRDGDDLMSIDVYGHSLVVGGSV